MLKAWGRNFRTRSLVVAAFIATTSVMPVSVAEARPGTVFWTAYLRTEPGEQYAVVDEIEPRSRLEVQTCEGKWCLVSVRGRSGYVEATLPSTPDIRAPRSAKSEPPTCFNAKLNGTRSGTDTRFRGQ